MDLLKLLLDRSEHYSLTGDFRELYEEKVRGSGRRAARSWARSQVLRLLPVFAAYSLTWRLIMLKNYLLTSLRNIRRQKGYTLINVFGLAVGIAACLLVLLYTRDELRYDRYPEKAGRIGRVLTHMNRNGEDIIISGTGTPAADFLKNTFPEVEETVRFRQSPDPLVRFEDRSFREKRVFHADPSFFKVFSIPLLAGDMQTALAEPNTLALSRDTALKYFGSLDAVGKTLRIDDKFDYKITGVFENVPRTSHFHPDVLLSLSTLDESRQPVWMAFNFPTYVVLRPGASLAALEAKLPALFNSHVDAELKQSMGVSMDDFLKKSKMAISYELQPLTRIHLYSAGSRNDFEPGGDIKSIYLFSIVALFILILAAVNFVNLSTARSSGRAKEVGLRKVLGSQRSSLVNQFLVESLLLSLIALTFAVVLVALTLPVFNSLAGKELVLSGLADPSTAATAFLVTLAIGLLAGAYPAVLFSSFRPSSILRGEFRTGMRGGKLRRGLVVFQSAVSVLMIIGTIVVFRQMHFIRTTNLGFNKDQVLVVGKSSLLGDRAEILKDEVKRLPQVRNASLSSFLPVPSSRARLPIAREDEPDPYKAVPVNFWRIDEDYLDTLQIKVAEGRNFSRALPTDADAVLINRAAAAHFRFTNPVGRKLILADMEDENGDGLPEKKAVGLNVIGLVEDFHFESLRQTIAPLVILFAGSRGNLILRVHPEGIPSLLKTLQSKWASLLPGEPFEYAFLDARFEAMYAADLRTGRIFGVFAALSVLIGCLGIFGLASYAVSKRAREIGIHKVLGANREDIVRLMLREQVLLTAASNLIAWPVAYVLMMNWLKEFAYRTQIGWMVFAGTGLLTLLITLLTVGGHAAKAVATQPAFVLKNE